MNRRTGPALRWLLLAALLVGDAAVAGACCLPARPSRPDCCPADEHRANAYVHSCEAGVPPDCASCKAYSGDRAAGNGSARPHGAQPGPALRPDLTATPPALDRVQRPPSRRSRTPVVRSHGPPVSRGPPPA